MQTICRKILIIATMAIPVATGACVAPAPSGPPEGAPAAGLSPSNRIDGAEAQESNATPIEEIVSEATPLEVELPVDEPDTPAPESEPQQTADGAAMKVPGTVGAESGDAAAATGTEAAGGAAASSAASVAAATGNTKWTGAYNRNPNLQVGKLYFDIAPGTRQDWRHCTATVVNAPNRSTIVTAGHCVFNPDPDSNGYVNGNGFWHEDLRFCPGYEYGCKLGVWKYRRASTTPAWVGGVSSRVNYSDDMAVVLLKTDTAGRYVQNVTGSQGITFNQPTGLTRYSFGYPAPDSRWTTYYYDGEDLIAATGRDSADSSYPGTMWMTNTMTGGSSGGPWIISPNSSWLGYVNSVNSFKPYGANYMNGPYFGNAEMKVFNDWKSL